MVAVVLMVTLFESVKFTCDAIAHNFTAQIVTLALMMLILYSSTSYNTSYYTDNGAASRAGAEL